MENINIHITLRSDLKRKDEMCRIDFIVYFRKKQFKISSGLAIEEKNWDKKSRKVLRTSEKASAINKTLYTRENELNDYILLKKVNKKEIKLEEIKEILKGKPSLQTNLQDSSFKFFFDKYIAHIELNEAHSNTLINYQSTLNALHAFMKHYYKRNVDVSFIDIEFIENFSNYLKNIRKNRAVTIGKRLRHLKTVIRYANKIGKQINNPFINNPIKGADATRIDYLSQEEYNRFQNIQLPKDSGKSIKLAYNLFIFSCETGLRYSDCMDLKWEHIEPDLSALTKDQVKTGNPVFVPLSPIAKKILISYKKKKQENVFPYINNQVLNRYLKQLGSLAKIKTHITFHVARHTFGTHLSNHLSPFDLCKLMGHKDINITTRYVNTGKEDLMKKAQKVWTQLK